MKSFFRLTVSIGIYLLYTYVSASNPIVRNYTRKESGSGTQNWDITQAPNDWMYFANNNGLLEFDGIQWNIYPIANRTNVRSIFFDSKSNRIYAGAFNEFGYYKRNDVGKMEYSSLIALIKQTNRNFSEIWNIISIGKVVYFQGDHVIFRYENDSVNVFRFEEKISYAANVQNTIVITQLNKGASILNGNLLVKISDEGRLRNKKVISILPYKENQIIFVTEHHGLYLYNGSTVEAFQTPADSFLFENQLFCATMINNTLAIGTVRKGLVIINTETKNVAYVNTQTGLQNNTVLSIAFDNQLNLWLGLDKGIDYVMINEPVYDLFGNSLLYGAGYASAMYNNNLYLGTNQGLYTYKLNPGSDGGVPFVRTVNSVTGQIWHLSVFDNTLFCGSDHGCYIINPSGIRHLQETTGTWRVREIPGRPDHLLGSSYNGFYILKKIAGQWRYAHVINGFSESGNNYEFDKAGNIWLSHWIKGVFKLVPDDNFTSFIRSHHYTLNHGLPANDNNRIFLYNDTIYVNTVRGVYQYQPTSDRFELSRSHPAFNYLNPYSRVIQYQKGQLWAFSNRVIKKISGDHSFLSVDSISYSLLKNKLIPGFEHSNQLSDGSFLVGTEDGFAHLRNLKKTSSYKDSLQVAIRKVYLTGISDSLLYEYLPRQLKVPKIKPRINSIRFEFSATEYRNDNELLYSFLLEPFDNEWSEFSHSRSKEYTNLPKGSYRFRVKAKNLYAATSGETFFDFVILPRWYESNFARVMYGLAVLILLFILTRLILRHSERKVERMKQLKEKEISEQKELFLVETKEKEKEIIELRNLKLQYELRHKSQDLANSTMNVIRKNEILMDVIHKLDKISTDLVLKPTDTNLSKQLKKMQDDIRKNIETDNNWKKFQENFDMVYENFLKRLGEEYPGLSSTDKKLCAYLKMELSSKDIAPLMNMSYRSVEMSRYRLRKKFELSRDINLIDFLRNF